MKSHLAMACALLALGMASSAFADGRVTATLVAPVKGQTKVIAAHAVFNCESTTCVAALAPDDANDAYACKDLARQVGAVTAYQEFKPLDEKALAKCNTAAPKPKAPAAAVSQ